MNREQTGKAVAHIEALRDAGLVSDRQLEMLPVMKAFAEGRRIVNSFGRVIDSPRWDGDNETYTILPDTPKEPRRVWVNRWANAWGEAQDTKEAALACSCGSAKAAIPFVEDLPDTRERLWMVRWAKAQPEDAAKLRDVMATFFPAYKEGTDYTIVRMIVEAVEEVGG